MPGSRSLNTNKIAYLFASVGSKVGVSKVPSLTVLRLFERLQSFTLLHNHAYKLFELQMLDCSRVISFQRSSSLKPLLYLPGIQALSVSSWLFPGTEFARPSPHTHTHHTPYVRKTSSVHTLKCSYLQRLSHFRCSAFQSGNCLTFIFFETL